MDDKPLALPLCCWLEGRPPCLWLPQPSAAASKPWHQHPCWALNKCRWRLVACWTECSARCRCGTGLLRLGGCCCAAHACPPSAAADGRMDGDALPAYTPAVLKPSCCSCRPPSGRVSNCCPRLHPAPATRRSAKWCGLGACRRTRWQLDTSLCAGHRGSAWVTCRLPPRCCK